jgi:hypothetical protein
MTGRGKLGPIRGESLRIEQVDPSDRSMAQACLAIARAAGSSGTPPRAAGAGRSVLAITALEVDPDSPRWGR